MGVLLSTGLGRQRSTGPGSNEAWEDGVEVSPEASVARIGELPGALDGRAGDLASVPIGKLASIFLRRARLAIRARVALPWRWQRRERGRASIHSLAPEVE
jgi:hypothetical protein